jgi:hypothetical protein
MLVELLFRSASIGRIYIFVVNFDSDSWWRRIFISILSLDSNSNWKIDLWLRLVFMQFWKQESQKGWNKRGRITGALSRVSRMGSKISLLIFFDRLAWFEERGGVIDILGNRDSFLAFASAASWCGSGCGWRLTLIWASHLWERGGFEFGELELEKWWILENLWCSSMLMSLFRRNGLQKPITLEKERLFGFLVIFSECTEDCLQ